MPSKKCEADGCNKWASFNLPGLKRPLYCRPHSTAGMVNVVSRQRCTYNDCPKQANFNHPGETRGLFCKEHIEDGMVDVRHKHCMAEGCLKQATCNVPGANSGAFCGQHKMEGMVNVVLKRCAHDGCETFPSFGNPGQPGVQYCRLHKLPGMTRRTSNTAQASMSASRNAQQPDSMSMDPDRCAHPGCGDCRPIYCLTHFQEHQHDPMAPQMSPDGQMHPDMQQYADLHHLHQQLQQQPEGDQQQQHGVIQLPLDGQAQMTHHMMTETGMPSGYPDFAAWQQTMAHSHAAHGMPAGEHVGFDSQQTVGNPMTQPPSPVHYHPETVTGHPQEVTGHPESYAKENETVQDSAQNEPVAQSQPQ